MRAFDGGAPSARRGAGTTSTSYRARRAWAEHLAETGHPTLRFDLPGTGDSGGVPPDPGRLAAREPTRPRGRAAWLRDAHRRSADPAIAMGLGGLVTLKSIGEGAGIDDVVALVDARYRPRVRRADRAFADLQHLAVSLSR